MHRSRYSGRSRDAQILIAARAELELCLTCGKKRWVHWLPVARRREIYPSMNAHKYRGTYKRKGVRRGQVSVRSKT